ncbi:MAG: type II toxin-antitoxin system VapC family toxin [Candidatus Dormibacteria bacterium]
MIEVVSDASVAIKWFHGEGEEGVGPARELVGAYRDGRLSLLILDLTPYEVGNALLRGGARASPEQVAIVLDSLAEICPAVAPAGQEMRLALRLAGRHGLTVYDAAYAAVARHRGALLATMDAQLLKARLGRLPARLMAELV